MWLSKYEQNFNEQYYEKHQNQCGNHGRYEQILTGITLNIKTKMWLPRYEQILTETNVFT
jgi:hypothetical protein